MKNYTFTTVIKKHSKLNAAFIEFPYSVEEEFGTKGQVKVRVNFDGYDYRGSLTKMGRSRHWIGITQEVRKAIDKNPGDTIKVVLQKDDEPRIVDIPDDFKHLLKSNSIAKNIFDKLSYTHQKEYVRWIESAKKPETRHNRLEKTIRMLSDKIKHR